MRGSVLLMMLAMPVGVALAAAPAFIAVPGGLFRSALKYEDRPGDTRVRPFGIMRTAVSNGQFLDFVRSQPKWQRGRVASVFADERYLAHWKGPLELTGPVQAMQPVTQVSWFAADAYCQARGARLPTWSEWEYAAAADETRRDARKDPAWRERILGWYSRPSNTALPRTGMQAPNVYGVQDLHGLVWEWTEDFSSMLVTGDNRNQGDADKAKFCGAGSLSMDDSENYAVLMRVAMLSSLEARDTTLNLGFRCARSAP